MMNEAVQIEQSQNGFSVKGVLTFDTVLNAYEISKPFFLKKQMLHINLSAVTHSDSAGLSLLARWMRLAKTQNIELIFSGLPDSIHDLSRVSGLDEILPIQHRA